MDYKSVIESRYNRQNWQLLLHDIFGNKIKFWNTPSMIPTSSQFAKQALWLGTITLSDNQTISVYEVELADSVDIERNRRGIRDMLLTDWRNNGNAGAFMFCYRRNESVLRFSYVSEAWTFADDGSYQKESTDAKRFTYLLGEGHRSRTAIQQFEKLRDSSLTLKDLTKAFSVDAVSDMFFDGYKKQYEDIIQYITGKRMVKVANKWEEQIKNEPCEEIMQEFAHFQNPEKAVRDYVKKLMGRLVFLQFLQKKGWLGVPAGEPWGKGDTEFIQTLFAQCNDKDHFVDNVLEPLFDDLNTEREGDNSQLSILNYQFKVPYLNGGLFERDATDETEFPLPAKYMQSLLDFFASYNFTIDENDPDDAEVGVDPEMLGRIFENLLEDNKDKGAFYTPKEIVSYMCRESLIAYLQTGIEDEATKEAIRQFVTTHDVDVLGTNDKFRQQVDEALKNVKICDPAIGSGAFPMGLLKELFQCRTALEGIDQHQAAEIKKHIIQQNIYGVDIERGAVDIARLRFWLSLIVDEETPQALPNLDFKIMQGNSLLEQYKGVDLSTITELKTEKHGTYQTTMFDDMIDVLRLDLRKMLEEYYDCTDHHKKQSLRAKIIDNVKQQLREQSINVDFEDLDLSGNNQFMLWHTWFYDVFLQGGFDIVIGNPPYNEISNKDEKKLFQSIFKDVLSKHYDLYIFFYKIGIDLLRENGILSYITPHTYTWYPQFTALRQYIYDKTTIISVTDRMKSIFDSAVVDNSIAFLKRGIINSHSLFLDMEYVNKELKIKDSIKLTRNEFDSLRYDYNGLINQYKLRQLTKECVPLGAITQSSQGITVYAKVQGEKINYFRDSAVSENSRPCLRGRSINKYQYDTNSLYIEYGKWLWCPRDPMFFENEKIFIRQTADCLIATYVKEPMCATDSLHSFISKDPNYDLKYILAILNSKLGNYMYKLMSCESGKVFAQVKLTIVRSLPIKIANKEQQKQIINLVDQILSLKKNNSFADTSILEKEIDRLVYQLYGLTEEEIKIVEES